MRIDNPANLTGDFVSKSLMGKGFADFRKIMREEKFEDHFRSNYFGYFLDLPEHNVVCFKISMVYGHLKRRIKYMGDNKDLKEEGMKMDEIWTNYCGIPICFGMKEFSKVT